MWRYAEVMPEADPVTLGEGFTPMLPSREFANVYIKDEGLNPTGSFKARGLSAAVTMAKAYGLKKLAIPPLEMPLAPWLHTLPMPALKRTSSCRKTFLSPTVWSAKATERASPW